MTSEGMHQAVRPSTDSKKKLYSILSSRFALAMRHRDFGHGDIRDGLDGVKCRT